MPIHRLIGFVSTLVAATTWAADVQPVPPPPAPAGPVVILARHALDGRGGELRDLRLGIAGGRITSLHAPTSGAVIDLRRYTVLPGWIDTHVHLASHFDRTGRIATESEPAAEAALGIAAAAWATLQGGFTTVQSVGDPSERPLRDAIRDHGFPGPRVLTSLAWIEGTPATSLEDLRAVVRARKAEGADLIKIFASSSQRVGALPTLTEAQLKVLCDEAAAVGLRSMVHAYRSQVSAAARAGCREIEHATYATPEDIAVAVAAGAYLSPQVGLVVQNYLANKARYLGVGNYTEEGMATMARDLSEDFAVCRIAVHTPGAKVVFSTDATAGAHGRNAEEFIGRVEHCGQSPMAALVSANALAAEAIGMGDRIGQLAPGFEADVIALDGNPLRDLTAVRRVVFVMRGGIVYKWPGAAPGP
ncbi:MAG: amidohydrolase family protein [Proteobacteria bacterium]|nr:amidohydrolase family protein [Pseudomonadota bacterium]